MRTSSDTDVPADPHGRSTGSSERIATSRVSEADRKLQWTLCGFLAAGVFFTLVNLDLPIARNALTAAKAALGIIEHHFNLFAVASDFAWTSGRPIFFPVLAAPFVWLFNANTGTIIASTIGSAFYLWMVACTLRRLTRKIAFDQNGLSLQLVLVALNPLVLYQFWSAYPDSLFAGLVLLSFILTDTIATEPRRDTRWHIVGLGVAIYLAIHTKLYGVVLGIVCPLYLLIHHRQLVTRSTHRRSKLAILTTAFALLAVVLLLAKLDLNPLLDFAEEASGWGGFSVYASGILGATASTISGSLEMVGLTVLLIFQFSLLFLATRAAWRAWTLAPTIFVVIYLAGLLTFSGTSFNMRYFLPVFPFVAVPLAMGARSIPSRMRQAVLMAYGLTAVILVLNFNFAPAEKLLRSMMSVLLPQNVWTNGWLDNLRLPVHIDLKKQIDVINAEVPPGSMLYWSSSYYDTGTHGLATHLGIKNDLDIRYVLSSSDIPQAPEPVFVYQYTTEEPSDRLWGAPAWAAVQKAGYGLFRLDPIVVELESVSGDYALGGSPIRLHARTSTTNRLQIHSVEFLTAADVLGSDKDSPFELNWQDASSGRHEVTARVRYGEDDVLVTDPITVFVGTPAQERTPRRRADIAVELPNGDVYFASPWLPMAPDGRLVGIRFETVHASASARLANAYLELSAAKVDTHPATLLVRAELSAHAAALASAAQNLSRRRRTTAVVRWNTRPWITVGQKDRSPNLAPVLAEVFAQPDWQPGNAVVLLIEPSGRRFAQVPGQNFRGAPRLYIELQHD